MCCVIKTYLKKEYTETKLALLLSSAHTYREWHIRVYLEKLTHVAILRILCHKM